MVFELVDELAQDFYAKRLALTAIHSFNVSAHGIVYIRYIAIGAYQIEIIQSAKRKHLGLDGLPVTATEAGVNFLTRYGHLFAFLKHQVTIVDAGVERGPVEHTFGRQQNGLLEVLDALL